MSDTAISETGEWTPLGTFTRDIGMGDAIRLAVERSATNPAHHRITCDEGKGPRAICTFRQPGTDSTGWTRAWHGDPLSPGILSQAREIARRANEG
ncbi:hypothetical protein [Glycomyces buryatensis]|uniref:Uncharacterized protein n=1 Tax=Glycomyces buryatensis TaxID=2570927 RepID=A0A4S8QFK6_9ACTN|nr:hypothetical protein [Glycomyces buryatensis]THV40099.1 hypothetical protein FAB82_16365 [Glycomyces buryatensis]